MKDKYLLNLNLAMIFFTIYKLLIYQIKYQLSFNC